MTKLLFNREKRVIVMKALICAFALSLFGSDAYSQQIRPDLPQLSFGIREGGSPYQSDTEQHNDWWPDNRIWTVPSRVTVPQPGDTTITWTEMLVPVFIENNWYNAYNVPGIVFDEISSFSFRVYYDDRVLEFVDVQKHHPYTEEEARNLRDTRFHSDNVSYYKPLSEHFHLTTFDEKATDYFKYFNLNDTVYKGVGKRVTVTGEASSFYSLPRTTMLERRVLVYLRFKVLPLTTSGSGQRRNSNLYFDPTYINYNGVNIAKDFGHKLLKNFPTSSTDPNYNSYLTAFRNVPAITQRNDNLQYMDRTWLSGKQNDEIQKMVGVQRYSNATSLDKYAASPYLPGSITVNVMNVFPQLRFEVTNPNSLLAQNVQITRSASDASVWILNEPIIADSLFVKRPNYNNRAERVLIVTTTGDPIRTMEDIIIETDQNWLRIRSASYLSAENTWQWSNNIFENNTRRAFVQRINNLISGDYNPFPTGSGEKEPTILRVFIECDQTGMSPGEYTGYVTFKSKFDWFEPTRVAVRFVILDNPLEQYHTTTPSALPEPEVPYGIKLKVTPFNGTSHTQTLIMGSAPNATDLVDSLYGEYPHPQALGRDRFGNIKTFDARFFIDSNVYKRPNSQTDSAGAANWTALVNRGFGDFAHLDGVPNTIATDNRMARSVSRDIRSAIPSEKSHIFYVKFRHENPNVDYYPVVLEWDVNQMLNNRYGEPNRNTIYLRYMMNGVQHTRDMRTEGTPIGSNRFTFTFTDKSVQEFWIEYTIAEELADNLKDNFGNDMIMPYSWNFVSLPLNPLNKDFKYIFRNAVGSPFHYTAAGWQQPVDGILQPGIGYFVKYQKDVDKQFSGAHFFTVNRNTFPVKLYSDVWNAIGALSVPMNVSNINFDPDFPSPGNPNPMVPDKDYTLTHGVWAYNTNKGYEEVPTLLPGQAYWIRVDRNGYLRLNINKTAITENSNMRFANKVAGFDRITVSDNSQKSANIYAANKIDANNYQLPPAPPAELFDVRFAKYGSYASNYDASIVEMQGVTYPVSVGFNNPRANYTVIDPMTGFVYGTVKAGSTENVVINNSNVNAFKLVAEAVADETFFVSVNQNPVVANNAEVVFGINENANVILSVFNALGNEVVKIELGEVPAGIHQQNINVANLPSGSYTVRLFANGESKMFRMNVVK